MKMKLVRDDERDGKQNFGKAGATIEGPEVWRFAFPCKGCLAKPIDSEANARIEREFAIVDPQTRARLIATMNVAGTLPLTVDPPPPGPSAVPVVAQATPAAIAPEVVVTPPSEPAPEKPAPVKVEPAAKDKK